MRIYMMERFLERLAQSEYRDNFIIKGGILVTAMIGVAHRSTMDIDTSMKNLNLSAEDALRVVNQVKDIDLDDGVSFEVKDVSNIMDEMEYPGIRVTMNANVGRLITPLKIDISTGDVITPRAIEFNYDLLLEDRSISLWSYNLETILAEKLQTVLARGILNTRMRDFYDIRMLLDTYEDKVNKAVLKDAFAATCKKRGTDHLQEQAEEIIKIIEADEQLQVLWRAYQKKYSYAADIDYLLRYAKPAVPQVGQVVRRGVFFRREQKQRPCEGMEHQHPALDWLRQNICHPAQAVFRRPSLAQYFGCIAGRRQNGLHMRFLYSWFISW